jgi:hypothetical protein
MNPKKNKKTRNNNKFLSKKRKSSKDEILFSEQNSSFKKISNDDENEIQPKNFDNICTRLSTNLLGYLFQFSNLNTIFNLVKVNKRIKNVILTKSPIFHNFIKIRKFYHNTKKNYLENILDSETTNLIFIRNKLLTEKYTTSQVDHFLTEILFTLFEENSHFNMEYEIKPDYFYLLSLVLISEKCIIRSLNFHEKSQTSETVEILSNMIRKNKTLIEIFPGPLQIKNLDYTNLFQSIGENNYLEFFKFDFFNLKESRKVEGFCGSNLMSLFENLGKNKSLKNFHFEFFDDFLNNQSLMISFKKMIEENKSIKHLSLRHHQDILSLDKINFNFLERNQTIETLELSGLFSLKNLTQSLTKAGNKSKISKLILDSSSTEKYVNGVPDKDQMIKLNYLSSLSSIITQMPFIWDITLKDSEIYEDKDLAKALENTKTLKCLRIDCMEALLNKTFEWLIDILKKNKSLEEISIYTLKSNHKEFQTLVMSLLQENKNLKSFYFNNENLHRQILDEIRKMIQDRKLNEINKILK